MIENQDFFLFRVRRNLPRQPGASGPIAPFVTFREVARIIPCWSCGGSIKADPLGERSDGRGSFYVCVGCGRSWFVEAGGNPQTMVIRVSLPSPGSGRSFAWGQRRPVDDSAWLAYLESMMRVHGKPVSRELWTGRQ